jgi:ankyrin repeat protein
MTPLILASFQGHVVAVTALLHRGANVHATTKVRIFPMCDVLYCSMHQRLLSFDMGMQSGHTALDAAQRSKHTKVANLLRNAGARTRT